MIEAGDIVDLLEDAVRIPSLPRAVVKLIALLGQDEPPGDALLAVLRVDPALVAEALRAANAAGGPVVTVDAALATLGERWLTRTLVARAMREARGEGDASEGPPTAWDHGIRTAVVAEILAPRIGVDPSVAYTAGILVDIGVVVASGFLARLGARLAASVPEEGGLPSDALERLFMGVDHAELAARIAQAWGLPEPLVEALRHHRRPEGAGAHAPLCRVVHAGDTVARLCGPGLGIDGVLYRVTSDPLPAPIRDRADVDALIATIEARVREIEALLEL